MTTLLTNVASLQAFREGLSGTVALVPTMGALHEGHMSLIREARKHADHVIVSDFVNPLQFGPGEDYEKYPRNVEADLAFIEGVADALFAPEPADVYPFAEPFQVNVGSIGTVLEGAIRPGHFNGVATVVLKLFLLARPHVAVFGQKDAQQLSIIRRLVHDFNLPVQIVSVPIVREESGLARSSRNAYLDDAAKKEALALSSLLTKAQSCSTVAELSSLLDSESNSANVTWEYKLAVHPATFEPIAADHTGEALVLLAARVHGVRLIDNAFVSLVPKEVRS